MPLPDERKAPSASSLIQRFQSQISSTEALLLPSSSFGSPGRPRGCLPSVAAGLGARTDEVRRSLDGRPTLADLAEKNGRELEELRNGEGGRAVWMRSAGRPVPAAHAGGLEAEPVVEPVLKKAVPPPQTLFTRPSVDVLAPTPVPSTLAPSSSCGSLTSPSDLSIKEDLSHPPSPLIESGRLSIPPPRDDSSPPPTSSPPSISPRPSSTTSSTSPSVRKSSGTPTRSGSISVPTASFLAKTKPRVSSSPRTSPSASRASPSASCASPTATPTRSPISNKTSPSLSRSAALSRFSALSRSSALSPPPSHAPRSPSSASTVPKTTIPRKVVPTSGTPRSRAAAAEKERLEKESGTPTSAGKQPLKASRGVKSTGAVPARGGVVGRGMRGGKAGVGTKVGGKEPVASVETGSGRSQDAGGAVSSTVSKEGFSTASIAGDAEKSRQDVESQAGESEDGHDEDVSASHDAASEMEIPDIPSDEDSLELATPRATTFADAGEVDEEEKVFGGFGRRPIGKIGVPVQDDGHGGLMAVGGELGKNGVDV